MVHYHYQPIEDSAVVNPHISTQSQPLKLLINEEKAQIQIQINLNLNTPCNSFVPPRKDPLPTLGNRRMLNLRILIWGIVEIVIWLGGQNLVIHTYTIYFIKIKFATLFTYTNKSAAK